MYKFDKPLGGPNFVLTTYGDFFRSLYDKYNGMMDMFMLAMYVRIRCVHDVEHVLCEFYKRLPLDVTTAQQHWEFSYPKERVPENVTGVINVAYYEYSLLTFLSDNYHACVISG